MRFNRLLGDDQAAVGVFDHLAVIGIDAVIGDHHIDFLQVAEAGEGLLAELAGIDEEDDFLGLAHHLALGVDQEHVLVVERAVMDAGDAEEEGLGVDGGDHILGDRAEKHTISRVHQAAGENELDVFIVEEKVGDGEGIGDELEGLAEEFLGDVEGGGAAINEDGLTGLNESAGGAGDGMLGIVAVAHALIEGVGARGGDGFIAEPDDAAVGAFDQALLLHGFEIAADG